MTKREDYLKVYRLTLHYKKVGKKGATTETLKNLSKIEVDSILGNYKTRADVSLIKHNLAFM